jgi:ribosomal protein S18 acetylase RimI-like enzyme
VEALGVLLESVGMRARREGQLRAAIANSSYAVFVYDGGSLIGSGRLVSDGIYYGSLWDIAVRQEYQNRGVGTLIVRELMRKAESLELYMVGLFTATKNKSFYEKFGFKFMDDVHAMTIDR